MHFNKTHTIQNDWSTSITVRSPIHPANSSTLMIDNRWPTKVSKAAESVSTCFLFWTKRSQFLKRLQLSNILMKTTSFRKIESHHAALEESGSSTNSQRSAHRWRYKSRMMGRVSSSHSWSLSCMPMPNERSSDGWPQRLSLPTAAHF